MNTVECIIGLKIPDNTAITAFQTLKRMGFSKLENLERRTFYRFGIEGKPDVFLKKIQQVDIILNVNKHWLTSPIQRYGKNQIFILVQNDLEENALLDKLHSDWKRTEISSVDQGILWEVHFESTVNAQEQAERIAKALLVNEHYQKYKIFR